MADHNRAYGPHAAALQCLAEDFRRVSAGRAATAPELMRFAGILDHIAASLIVGGQAGYQAAAFTSRPELS